jgi:actin-related protein
MLGLYYSGRTTGIVCESGHGVTFVSPIYEGNMISEAISKTQIAGDYLTKFLNKLLDRKNEKLVNL